jgi:hypothetical protein
MSVNASVVWKYLQNHSGKTAIAHRELKEAVTVQLSEVSFYEAMKQLIRDGYVRVNGAPQNPLKTYTILRSA